MRAIDNLRDGYTAGASDDAEAVAEFERLVRAAGIDANHAAAIERERIAAFLERAAEAAKSQHLKNTTDPIRAFFGPPTQEQIEAGAYQASADVIRNGDHWKDRP